MIQNGSAVASRRSKRRTGKGRLLPLVREKMKSTKSRVLVAMACYCALILAALYALLPVRSSQDRFLLGAVLCVFAILIIKTLVHAEDENSD